MEGGLRRIRGAVGMGLTWAVAWGLVGVGIELIHNIWPTPLGSAVDIWPATLAFPAFLCGLAFSTVLGIAGRRRRFDELSLSRFATWGAAGGAVVSILPAALISARAESLAPGSSIWMITGALGGSLALLGAASASGCLMLARRAEGGAQLEAHRTDSAVIGDS